MKRQHKEEVWGVGFASWQQLKKGKMMTQFYRQTERRRIAERSLITTKVSNRTGRKRINPEERM